MVNEEKKIFELIEVEDIVPMGANSLFLCVARTIIYLTYKNPHLLNILKSRLRINADLFKSDVALQFQLRIKLCEYFLKNGVQYDDQTKTFKLKYSSFNGNVFDFLVQVYQLSINNFGENQLFLKHATYALSRLLGMNVYCRKLGGQWRFAEQRNAKEPEDAYLSKFTIYLRELQFTNQIGKNYRVLLPKNIWLSNRNDNMNISLRFSQFSDRDDLSQYQSQFFLVGFDEFISTLMGGRCELSSASQRAFCVFLNKINVKQITQGGENWQEGQLPADIGRLFENADKSNDLEALYSVLNKIVEKPKFFNYSEVNKGFYNLMNEKDSGAKLCSF